MPRFAETGHSANYVPRRRFAAASRYSAKGLCQLVESVLDEASSLRHILPSAPLGNVFAEMDSCLRRVFGDGANSSSELS